MQFNDGSILGYMPSNWVKEVENVFISAYSIFPQIDIRTGQLIIDLADDVRVILCQGTLNYEHHGLKWNPHGFNDYRLQHESEMRTISASCYLFLLSKKEESIEFVSTLLALVLGKCIIANHLFTENHFINGGKVVSIPINHPQIFEKDITNDIVLEIATILTKIKGLKGHDSNKIKLSLRWYKAAIVDDGIDAFLKTWIALETIGTDGNRDIKLLNKDLSSAYNLPYNEIAQLFHVGRIFNFRSKIVHKGLEPIINQAFLSYVEGLYQDILYQKLKLSCEKVAMTRLNNTSLKLLEVLAQ